MIERLGIVAMVLASALAAVAASGASPSPNDAVCMKCPGEHVGWTTASATEQLRWQSRNFISAMSDVQAKWMRRDGTVESELEARLYVRKDGTVRIDLWEPARETVLVVADSVYLHKPEQNLVERHGRKQFRYEPYTRLGFTQTGKELGGDFVLSITREEFIDGRRVLVVDLTPKSKGERERVAHIALWIDQASWLPMRQTIEEAGTGNVLQVEYSGTVRNLELDSDIFRERWPRGTKKVNVK